MWFGLAFAIFHFSPLPAPVPSALFACASNRVNCCGSKRESPALKCPLEAMCKISLSYINQANLPETSAKSNANGEWGRAEVGWEKNPEKSNQLKSYSIHFPFPCWNERQDCGKSHSGSQHQPIEHALRCPLRSLITNLYSMYILCIVTLYTILLKDCVII